MLALVGTHYHFRRVVPVALRPLFGKTEFWISLKTGSKSEARLSAMALHAQTSALFRTARLMTDPARKKPITKDDLLALYQDIIKKQKEVIETNERNAAEQLKLERYRASMTRYEDLLKTRAFITYSSEALERLNQNMTRLRQDMITGTAQDKTSLARKTEEIDRLHATLVKLFQTGPALSQAPGAVPPSHQLASPTRTVALFVQAFGDKPVKEITGRVAGEFRRGFLTLEAISGHFVEFSHPRGARSGILTIFCFWRRVLNAVRVSRPEKAVLVEAMWSVHCLFLQMACRSLRNRA